MPYLGFTAMLVGVLSPPPLPLYGEDGSGAPELLKPLIELFPLLTTQTLSVPSMAMPLGVLSPLFWKVV